MTPRRPPVRAIESPVADLVRSLERAAGRTVAETREDAIKRRARDEHVADEHDTIVHDENPDRPGIT